MEPRLIIFSAVVIFFAACSKTSVPESVVNSHEIVVSIADSQVETKCTVDDSGKTSFSIGDEIEVVDSKRNNARYTYKSKQSGEGGEKYVFQKQFGEKAIDTSVIIAACYPSSSFSSYNKSDSSFTLTFVDTLKYKEIGTQTVSAPMVCFETSGSIFEFKNISCLLQIGFICNTELVSEIRVQTIKVSSDENPLNQNFIFYQDGYVEYAGGRITKSKRTVYLTDCESAGAISSTDVKYFYFILPPISDMFGFKDDTLTVEVSFVNHSNIVKRITVPNGDYNKMVMNKILTFEIKIDPE